VIELASTQATFNSPRHPYTQGLLRSVPRLQGSQMSLASIPGLPPDLGQLPEGCPFAPRCPIAAPDCLSRPVPLAEVTAGHSAACLFPERVRDILWTPA